MLPIRLLNSVLPTKTPQKLGENNRKYDEEDNRLSLRKLNTKLEAWRFNQIKLNPTLSNVYPEFLSFIQN